MKKIKVGSDFSGVGAFDQALKRLGINYETIFACDMDKYARQTFIHNYSLPKYYPENVYNREIPTEPLDIYMTSPPCQAFSLAGKRKGEDDKRGILFYNSHEFIKKNNPRYFIFENVKGLLSDDNGKTFGKWIDLLGGKSVNGNQVMFPNEDSVPYHIYHKVLNAKNYGVPQNRERVFIIGIRDDVDNNFSFPKEQPLTKRLKDVLEYNVDEKYYLSDKQIEYMQVSKFEHSNRIHDIDNISPTLTTMQGGGQEPKIKVKSATSKGYELAEIGEDSINFEHPNSKTRRGRVGVGVGQTLTTSCNQGVCVFKDKRLNKFIQENELKPLELIDTYNQVSNTDITHTITTRVNASNNTFLNQDYRIRKLTPRECFRLMDFPDDFDFSVVSDSQAYKQAGNSIVVNVLTELIKKLHF